MITIRKSEDRGYADHGWLKSFHTFSFADYFDPAHMGFGALRVINEDRIAGGMGFPPHPHRDMEIITYVVSGALEHKDSGGNSTVIRPGEVQRMSAGTGVRHSEYNHLKDQETHLFQIWILPDTKGVPFSYGQKSFAESLTTKSLTLVVSKDGRDGSIAINQDTDMYVARLKGGQSLHFEIRPKRGAWLQVVKGALTAGGHDIVAGDGLSALDEKALELSAVTESEVIIFDLA